MKLAEHLLPLASIKATDDYIDDKRFIYRIFAFTRQCNREINRIINSYIMAKVLNGLRRLQHVRQYLAENAYEIMKTCGSQCVIAADIGRVYAYRRGKSAGVVIICKWLPYHGIFADDAVANSDYHRRLAHGTSGIFVVGDAFRSIAPFFSAARHLHVGLPAYYHTAGRFDGKYASSATSFVIVAIHAVFDDDYALCDSGA